MYRWPQPRIFILSAVAVLVLAIILLYAGLLKTASMLFLAFVLLSVLSVIALAVADIEHAVAQRNEPPSPAKSLK